MPRYFTPDGKSYYTDKELAPADLDELMGYKSTTETPSLTKGGLLDTTIPLSKRLMNVLEGPDTSIEGDKIVGQGFMKVPGMEKLGENIRNKGINTGNWYLGALGSMIGGTISDLATSFDPRTAGHEPMIKPKAEAITASADALGMETPKPLGLPPAPTEAERTFAAGPSGGSGQVIDLEKAKNDPRNFYQVIGSDAEPRGSSANLEEVTEANRQAGLKYTAAEQEPGSRLLLPNKQLELPPESSDVTGGFSKQTSKEMEWPYNVIPNQLRPRASQTEILGQSGLKGVDLSNPVKSGDRIHFVSGGPDNSAFRVERPDFYTGTGQPVELLHPNMREPMSEIIEQPKKPLDVINSSPIEAKDISDTVNIPPGQADVPPIINRKGKDISAFRSEFSSPHVIMDNFPASKKIIQPIMDANDQKYAWLASTMRDFADISKGLDREKRTALTYILNGEDIPHDLPYYDLVHDRAVQAKQLLDDVWQQAKDKHEDMGFIDRYITHIKAQPDDFQSAIKSVIDHQFGKESGWYKIFSTTEEGKPTGNLGDLFERGLGNPDSPYTRTRINQLQDIEVDYNKIIPTYLESMAKVIHDKPVVDAAKNVLGEIPNGKLKEYLQGYIKNYTRYDSDPLLANAWNSLANQIATINARSVISFNPVVHMYHLGQLPANIWPELGTKYSMVGLKDFLSNPSAGYKELAENGLFSNMIRPMRFQTPMQKFDSVGYFMNMVESIVKGTGYYGLKAKYLDSGMKEAEAALKAIQDTKNLTATVDPARQMRYFAPESNIFGGQMARLGKQYHQIPIKLVEQFARAAGDLANNPAKAARYIAGSTIAGVGSVAGLHTLHINPSTLAKYTLGGAGQFGSVMSSVYRNLSKGDIGSALENVLTWAVPGGATIKKLISNQ